MKSPSWQVPAAGGPQLWQQVEGQRMMISINAAVECIRNQVRTFSLGMAALAAMAGGAGQLVPVAAQPVAIH
jgi:hypothetical protein